MTERANYAVKCGNDFTRQNAFDRSRIPCDRNGRFGQLIGSLFDADDEGQGKQEKEKGRGSGGEKGRLSGSEGGNGTEGKIKNQRKSRMGNLSFSFSILPSECKSMAE